MPLRLLQRSPVVHAPEGAAPPVNQVLAPPFGPIVIDVFKKWVVAFDVPPEFGTVIELNGDTAKVKLDAGH